MTHCHRFAFDDATFQISLVYVIKDAISRRLGNAKWPMKNEKRNAMAIHFRSLGYWVNAGGTFISLSILKGMTNNRVPFLFASS